MIGTLFLNRYRIETQLGQGGMGTVYRAHDTLLDRNVAVKMLSSTAIGSEGRARLLREAQSAARLNHPNIVSIFDAGESEGNSFIIMELLDGESLYDQKPASLADMLDTTRQICDALEHAHAHGIIHRDLKPENVIVTRSGIVKLTDFGLARSATSRLTVEGSIIGTVFYISPEQALGKEIDHRADLYSLGVMLYELTTGRLPFTASDPVAVISQHLYAPVTPPSTYAPELPAGINSLIMRLLSKNPDERPTSAAAVRLALDPEVLEIQPATPQASNLELLVRGRLIAREREFAQARRSWKLASAGSAEQPVLLITGEAGVGKTPLIREIKALAEISGGYLLSSECYPEGSPPYTPFVDMIQEALGNPDLVISDEILADLVTLSPALRAQFPQVAPNHNLQQQGEHLSLYESVVAFFSTLSALSPVLMVIEDVQWADGETVTLLRYLARRVHSFRLRMLMLFSYRESDIDSHCCLSEILLELNRERLTERLKLARYDHEQTRQVLESLFQESPSIEFLDAIYQETEGNLFYIEEVCKALIEQGILSRQDGHWQFSSLAELQLPQSVRMAIQARLSKLPDAAQDVLRMAAFIGRIFDFDTLRLASELDEDALVDALEKAERAQLISEYHPDHPERKNDQREMFAFAHGLITATLHEATIGLRRSRLHRRVAEAISQLRPNDYETLAYHFEQARDAPAAYRYYALAANKALSAYANREAERYYRAALDLTEADQERGEVQSGLGEVLFRLGRYPDAIEVWLEGIALHRKTGNHDEASRLYGRAARAAWYAADAKQGLELCRQGLSERPTTPEGPGLAALLHETARAYFFNELGSEAMPICQKALDLAQRLDLKEVQAETLTTMGILPNQTFEEKKHYLVQAVDIADSIGLLATAARAHLNLGGRYEEQGDYISSLHHFHLAYERAKKLGNLAWMFDFQETIVDNYLIMGELSSADEALKVAESLIQDLPNPAPRIDISQRARFMLLYMRGETRQASELLRQAITEFDETKAPVAKAELKPFLAIINCELGEFAQAIPLLEEALPVFTAHKSEEKSANALFLGALAASMVNRIELARQYQQELDKLSSRHPDGVLLPAMCSWVHARLAAAETRWESASNDYTIALEALSRYGIRWHQARLLLDWAELLYSAGHHDEARQKAAQAADIFRQIGAPGYVTRADALAK